MVMMAYTIVEFEDRVEMVPTKWLSADKKSCMWPDMKDQIRINDIIALKETPDPYNISNVQKILDSADTYELGKEKLKLAKQKSDIGSDTGTEDATALKKAEADSTDGKFSPKKSHILDQHQRNSHENGMSTDIISKNKRETLINDDGTDPILDKQPNESRENGRKSDATLEIANEQQSDCTLNRAGTQNDSKLPERQTSERTVTLEQLYDILREVCLKLNLLESKMTTIEVEIGDKRKIVSTGQSRPFCDDDLDGDSLPFGTSKALEEFDKKLSVPDFHQSMVETLKVIGNIKLQPKTSKILAKIMQNRLAEGYNLKGKGKKKQFEKLENVVDLIKNVVKEHNPQFTDKDIEGAISKWLAGAKTRRVAEEKKAIREDNRKQSE